MKWLYRKKGIFLPLVLLLLIVLALLGLMMNRSAIHEYRFTYRSVDHLRASYIAESAIQTMLAYIKQEMNREDKIRDAFIDDGATEAFLTFDDLPGEYQDAVTKDLQDKLTMKEGDETRIDHPSFEIEKLEATLSESFLMSKLLNVDAGPFGDRTKKLVVTVELKFNSAHGAKRYGDKASSFIKKISQCFDCKVADVRPVGNKYVMMVATVEDESKDFNGNNGSEEGHFYVSNVPDPENIDNEKASLGVSIGCEGEKANIDLFPEYYTHKKGNSNGLSWDEAKNEKLKCSDLYIKDENKINSPRSLIPGWEEPEFYEEMGVEGDTGGDDFVPDNEPWENVFPEPDPNAPKLLDLLTAREHSPKPIPTGGEQVHLQADELNLLNTANGRGIETSDKPTPTDLSTCGPGIPWERNFTHPKTKRDNLAFYNSGIDSGWTHLFYQQSSVPCPVFGNVMKRWKVYRYRSVAEERDTGTIKPKNNKVNKEKCAWNTIEEYWEGACIHHFDKWKKDEYWDTTDLAYYEVQKDALEGQYQVNDEGTWSDWNKDNEGNKGIPIDYSKNFKGKEINMKQQSGMIKEFFRSGATRIVKKDSFDEDKSLLDEEGTFYPEGVLELKDAENMDLKLKFNNPGCVIAEKKFTLSLAKYSKDERKSDWFKISKALSLVCENVVTVATPKSEDHYAGICALGVRSEQDIRLKGNMAVRTYGILGKKEIQGELLYDDMLKNEDEFIVDDVGEDEKCAFVITISPISQEFVDHYSLIKK